MFIPDPGSGFFLSRIRIPRIKGSKKQRIPYSGYGSATLVFSIYEQTVTF
jgi:hypothetical protein